MASIADMTTREAARMIERQIANQSSDPNVNSAQKSPTNSNSASTVLSTLAPVAIIALIWFLLFLFLRRRFPRWYRPRTFIGILRQPERTPKLPDGLFNWVGAFFNIPDTHVLNAAGSLDGYLFLRLLKVSVVSCLVGCLITFPVLFPVNATGGGGLKQLDILTFGNVTNTWRYYAHAGCAYVFFGFIIYMITRESIYYINLRQAYLLSPLYASRLSSRTVLFTSVPPEYANEANLRRMLGGSVRRVWIATDTKELDDLVEERDTIAMKLEGAETQLITIANGNRLKSLKKHKGPGDEEEHIAGTDAQNAVARWVPPKQRPTHRLKPIIGKKVDTIDWCRAELQKIIPEVEEFQAKHRAADAPKLNSVFVEFDTLAEAQAAFQSLTHHQPLHMAPRFTGMNPAEIIWSNLRIKWWERIIRIVVATTIVVALVIFWSIPVAVVGSISNINYLTSNVPFLGFINQIPPAILGVVTGLLPVILLAALMALLPIILRLIARLSGDPTLSAVEYTVQNYYFAFQVIQVYLVATLGSAASSVASEIANNPASVTSLLASQLPKASNFYLSYFILQGLGVVAGTLVGLTGLILFKVLGKLLDKTPRKMYQRWVRLSSLGWGTVYPVFTNLFIIAICYSCVAPLVLAFAAIGLYLVYLLYRYNLLFVYNINVDTKGLVYPRALQQIFVGLYLAELTLIGLFAISVSNGPGAIGPLILMVLFLVFTALYQISLNTALEPLLKYLPKSLESKERSLMEAEEGTVDDEYLLKGSQDGIPSRNGFFTSNDLGPAPHKKPNLFSKWLRPDIYTDYKTMRRLVPRNFANIVYDPEIARDAYFHPSITSPTPLLWIPRDPLGVSAQEVRETSKVIPITDEGAHVDEKNKVVWDSEDGRPPIYQEKVYY